MEIVLVHDHFDADHLEQVIAEMRILGPPTIRVYDTGMGSYQAIEGCHRLRACAELGLIPEIIEVDRFDRLCEIGDDFDVDYNSETIAAEIGDWENIKLSFDV